ncbi:MAG: aminoglycoside phosphotransferase family protein [Chloroflexi bacterium]|nr:aminoglycoside phosphotransferase family protein [Chloroflexota bacterium]
MTIDQPTAVPVSSQALQTIAARLGVPQAVCERLPSSGRSNAIYAIGAAYLLRVPHLHLTQPPTVHREVVAVAAAQLAGVRTPSIVLFDDSCEVVPVPYAVYERIAGMPLSALAPQTTPPGTTWYAVGQDLARLHRHVTADTDAGHYAPSTDPPDPRPWLNDLTNAQLVPARDVAWLECWVTRLAPWMLSSHTKVFCHGDVNASNILVAHDTLAYQALIDWGGVVWHDPAWDFAPVPLTVVPAMLAGYRSLAVFPDDATMEARVLAYHLAFAVWGLRFQPQPGSQSARERVARLRAQLARFIEHPSATWIAHLS